MSRLYQHTSAGKAHGRRAGRSIFCQQILSDAFFQRRNRQKYGIIYHHQAPASRQTIHLRRNALHPGLLRMWLSQLLHLLPRLEKVIRHLPKAKLMLEERLYSVCIAASGLSFMARRAGKYPATIPINVENATAANANHHGITEIFPPIPSIPAEK